jgi:hypothetical protein
VAEDKGGSPLPRRVPGTKRGPGTGPLARPALSESDLQRIRAALDSVQAQARAPAPPNERPAPLPRRTRRADSGTEPPAHTPLPELPAAFLPTRPKEAPTKPPPGVPAPRPGEATEETNRQPDVTAEPESDDAAPADPQLIPAQRAPAEQREVQGQPDEEKVGPERDKASAKQETASPKSAPPTAPASPPVPARPRKRGRGCAIITGSAIATLVLLSAGSSALLLTRHSGPARTRPDASTGVAVRDRAAAWVASQVGRARLVSRDQKMCQALHIRTVRLANGRDVVRIEFTAPSRFGLLGTPAP